MFRGISSVGLDAKGRIALPIRHREQLEKRQILELVLTIDTDTPCLLLYTMPDWLLIEQKLQALPSFNPTARRIQRLLIGHATELSLDTNGRLLIPSLLREYAQLDKQVTLLGQGRHFEIWSEAQWASYQAACFNTEHEFLAELSSLSL